MNFRSHNRYFLILSLPLVYFILLFLGLRQGDLSRETLNNEIDRTVKNYGFPVYRIIQEQYEFLDFITDIPPDSSEFENWDIFISYLEFNFQNLQNNSDYIIFSAAISEESGKDFINILKESEDYSVDIIKEKPEKTYGNISYKDDYIVINRTLGPGSSFSFIAVIDYKAIYRDKIIPELKDHFSQEELFFQDNISGTHNYNSQLSRKNGSLTLREIIKLRNQNSPFPLPSILVHGPGFDDSYSLNLFRSDRMKKSKKPDFNKIIPENYFYSELNFMIEGKSLLQYTIDKILFSTVLNILLMCSLSILYTLIVFQILKLSRIRQKEREFVSAITHELRTPLTVIHNAGDNMRQGIIKGERVIKYGDLIVQQGKRLGDMIESILLFSNLENKTVPGSFKEETFLGDWLTGFRKQMDSLASAKGYFLYWDYADTNQKVLFPRSDVELILSNLISNALRHAYISRDSGQIRIKMTMSHPAYLVFIIEDDGSGIPRQDKNRIFKPFERGRESREAQKKGTGLGLHIARKKAENIQGKLVLESPYTRPDETTASGCRFILTVPVQVIDKNNRDKKELP